MARESLSRDRALQSAVERLLELAGGNDDRLEPRGAMKGSLWQEVVSDLESGRDGTTLGRGDRIGSYEIFELLGSGGMGTVYRARDPNLDRDVAVKVLSSAFQEDPSFLRRFEREAKLLASLNHSNIGVIYDLLLVEDKPYLVLELVDGPTLADRLLDGPMSVDETLSVAGQIAQALEEAHRKGVIHRDLKPGNVKLSSEDRVKVLDFGLAKSVALATDPKTERVESADAPTTRSGMILGTASYMSPEQARGQTVDKRTDIWAFGCLLYEMLTGERLFRGETSSDTLASVLRDEVDWNRLPAMTPATLRRLVRRCLQRDRRERLQDIGDARLEIAEITELRRSGAGGAAADLESPPRGWRPRLVLGTALGALALLVLAIGLFRWRPEAPAARTPVLRTSITIGPEERLWVGLSPSIALSPDGSRLAFVAGRGGQSRLYLRELESDGVSEVRNSDGAAKPLLF